MSVAIKPSHYAFISVPFLVLTVLSYFPGARGTFSLLDQRSFSLLSDLVFLNNVHACFSFFLYYKVPSFQKVIGPFYLMGAGALIAATVSALLFVDLNNSVLLWLATIHAIMQSGGLFLMFFCPKEKRGAVKVLLWLMVFLILSQKVPALHLERSFMMILGGLFFVWFSLMTRSVLGILFSIRFCFWFSESPLGGFSVNAIHGLEYLLVTLYILNLKSVSPFKLRDFGILLALLAIPSYYTLNLFYGVYVLPLAFLFYVMVYSHYMFDTYSFRFKFRLPRQFILPLFKEG